MDYETARKGFAEKDDSIKNMYRMVAKKSLSGSSLDERCIALFQETEGKLANLVNLHWEMSKHIINR